MEKTQRQTIINFFLILIVSACTPLSIGTPDSTAETYRPSQLTLAVWPSRALPYMYQLWLPVVNYLAARTGMSVKLSIPNEFGEFVPLVLDSQPEVIYIPGLEYLTLHRDAGYEAVVAAFPSSISILVVKADSPINTINDLRGKTIALVSPSSLGGHQQMRAFLADNGLVADQDYRVIILENATLTLNAVTDGKADAAATTTLYYAGIPAEQQALIRIIAETPPLPPAPFAVRGDLAAEIREMLVRTLVSMNETSDGQMILEQYGWDQMSRTDDTAYDIVREFAEEHGIEYK